MGLVILALLAWFFVDFGEFFRSITSVSAGAALVLLVASVADRVLMALKWWHLGRAIGIPVRRTEYVAAYWGASFLSYFLPTSLGGEIYRGFRISRAAPETSGVLATMILEKMIGVLATIFFAWMGLAYLLTSGIAPDARAIFLGLLAFSVLAVGGFALSMMPSFHRRSLGLWKKLGVVRPMEKLSRAYSSFSGHPGVLLGNFGLALVENALQLALTWGAAVALGVDLPVWGFFAIIAVTQFLRRITMIFDGWGLSEALRLVTYGLIGVSGSDTLAIALVGHAIMALASVPGALVFFRDPDRRNLARKGGGAGGSADADAGAGADTDANAESSLGASTPSGPPPPTDDPTTASSPEPFAPHKLRQFTQRFLMPPLAVTIYYLLRDGAKVSHRAEVEATPNLRFGRGCTVSSFVKIKATEGLIHIGARSGFATGCFISSGAKGIEIGCNVLFGPNVTVLGSTYVYDELDVPFEDQGHTSKGVTIGNNVWIGAGSVIADGAKLGDNTIVVANSLVTRRYPDNVIIQGTPAKVIMRRGRTEQPSSRREVECEAKSSESSKAPSAT